MQEEHLALPVESMYSSLRLSSNGLKILGAFSCTERTILGLVIASMSLTTDNIRARAFIRMESGSLES